ncbi:MAG: hypothetical protein LBE18_04510, partial [Planctomycetaceae bacterium]|nr:hypothetical protein [Planctomycetaceae bacterium]
FRISVTIIKSLKRKAGIAAYVTAARNTELGENEKQLAYSIKRRLNQWDESQRKECHETMQRAWQHFYDTNEGLRESIESHKKGFSKILQERYVEE